MRVEIFCDFYDSKADHIDPVEELGLIHLTDHHRHLPPFAAKNGLSSSGKIVPALSERSGS
jgi:hypothetical protein